MPESQGPGAQAPSAEVSDFDEEAKQFRDQVNEMSRGGNMSRRDAAYELAKADNQKATAAVAELQAAEKRLPSNDQSSEQSPPDRQEQEGRLPSGGAAPSFGYERLDLQGQQDAAARHFKAQTTQLNEARRANPEPEMAQPETARDEGRKPSPEAVNGHAEATKDEGRRKSPASENDRAQTNDGVPREMSDRDQTRDAYKELIREHQNQEHNLTASRGTDQSRS